MSTQTQEPSIGWTESLGAEAANPQEPHPGGERLIVFEDCPSCNGAGVLDDDSEEPCPDCQGSGKTDEIAEEYPLSPCENRIRAQFEQWVRRNGLLAIREAGEVLGPAYEEKMRDTYIHKRSAGHYTWDGKCIRDSLVEIPGLRYFFFLILRRCTSTITEQKAHDLFMDDIQKASRLCAWSLGNSQRPRKKGARKGSKAQTRSSDSETSLTQLTPTLPEAAP